MMRAELPIVFLDFLRFIRLGTITTNTRLRDRRHPVALANFEN